MKNKIIFILCLSCVIIGGLLPYISLSFSDYYFSLLKDSRTINNLQSMMTSGDVKNTLLLLSDEHNELEYYGDTNISLFNINVYAKTITEELISNEILPDFNMNNVKIKSNIYLISPKFNSQISGKEEYIAVSRNALVWKCDFYNIDGITYSLWIDDNSGKMVAMYFGGSESVLLTHHNRDINHYNDFFMEYYNYSSTGLIYDYNEKEIREYTLPILSDNGSNWIRFTIYKDFINFNL